MHAIMLMLDMYFLNNLFYEICVLVVKFGDPYASKEHTHPSHNQDDSYNYEYEAAYASRKHIHPSQDEDIHKLHKLYIYRNTQKNHKEVGKL